MGVQHELSLEPVSRAASVQRYIGGKRVPWVVKLPVSTENVYGALLRER